MLYCIGIIGFVLLQPPAGGTDIVAKDYTEDDLPFDLCDEDEEEIAQTEDEHGIFPMKEPGLMAVSKSKKKRESFDGVWGGFMG